MAKYSLLYFTLVLIFENIHCRIVDIEDRDTKKFSSFQDKSAKKSPKELCEYLLTHDKNLEDVLNSVIKRNEEERKKIEAFLATTSTTLSPQTTISSQNLKPYLNKICECDCTKQTIENLKAIINRIQNLEKILNSPTSRYEEELQKNQEKLLTTSTTPIPLATTISIGDSVSDAKKLSPFQDKSAKELCEYLVTHDLNLEDVLNSRRRNEEEREKFGAFLASTTPSPQTTISSQNLKPDLTQTCECDCTKQTIVNFSALINRIQNLENILNSTTEEEIQMIQEKLLTTSTTPIPLTTSTSRKSTQCQDKEKSSEIINELKKYGDDGGDSKSFYILTLGVTSSGKSRTLDFLFGNRNIFKIGDGETFSSKIEEYEITDENEPDIKINVIDTPGIGVPKSHDDSEKVLQNLERYLKQHSHLSHTPPNIVLFFTKFDDNRFPGSSSVLIEMIKDYENINSKIQFITESNSVFVLTYFMSETKKVTKKPKEKIDKFKEAIVSETNFNDTIHFVVAENNVLDADIEENEDGFYQLPNKEFYPKNIFDKLIQICENSYNSEALIVKKALNVRKNVRIEPIKHKIKEKNNDIDEVKSDKKDSNSNLKNTDDKLKQTSVENICESEVSKLIDESFQRIDILMQINFPETTKKLKNILEKKGIELKEDIPKKPNEIAQFLKGENLDYAMIKVFKIAFYVTIPEQPYEIITGRGYDIQYEKMTPKTSTIFNETKFSSAGYMIPKNIRLLIEENEENIFKIHHSQLDFIKSRFNSLEITEDYNTSIYFQTEFNGESSYEAWNNTENYINLKNVKIFEIITLNLEDEVIFTEDFLFRINNLPPFNLSSKSSKEIWKLFIDDYGAYVISSSKVGGKVETTLKVKNEILKSLKSENNVENVRRAIEDLPYINNFTKNFQKKKFNSIDYEVIFEGGDDEYILTDEDFAEASLQELSDRFFKWKDSIKQKGISLYNNIKLKPLSYYVRKINETIANEMDNARRSLLNGHLNSNFFFDETEEEIPDFNSTFPIFPIDDRKNTNEEFNKDFTQHVTSYEKNLESILNSALQKNKDNMKHFEAKLTTTTTPRTTTTTTKRPTPRPSYTNNFPKETTNKRTTTRPSYTNNFPQNICKIPRGCFGETGMSYSLAKESTIDKSPFIDDSRYASCRSVEPYDEPSFSNIRIIYKTFPSLHDYRILRYKSLSPSLFKNISAWEINSNPSIAMLPGHNLINKKISIAFEFRAYKTSFRENCELVSEEFFNAVKNLPVYYNQSCYAIKAWRQFYDTYGTHYIKNMFIGGSIQLNLIENSEFYDEVYNHDLKDPNYFYNIDYSKKIFTFNVKGGDKNILKSPQDFTKENLVKWAESLKYDGIPLKYDITLVPYRGLIIKSNPSIKGYTKSSFLDYIKGHMFNYCNLNIFYNSGCKSPNSLDPSCFYKLRHRCYLHYDHGFMLHHCPKNSECILNPQNISYCRCNKGFSEQKYYPSNPFSNYYECQSQQ